VTVVIASRRYRRLLTELERRGRGKREAGAFLLANARGTSVGDSPAVVVDVAYYDDLDPNSLTGGITFGADGYTALGALCGSAKLVAVADIHTHPSRFVQQSTIDATNPMVAIAGHVAVIVPNYAIGTITPTDLGVHEFLGAGAWRSTYGDDAARVFVITRMPVALRLLVARLRDFFERGPHV
jgi:hypothetical protein